VLLWPTKDFVLRILSSAPYPVRQGVLGTAYLLAPRRLPNLPLLVLRGLRDIPRINRPLIPRPEDATKRPDGFCGLAGQIGVSDLLTGYSRGLFVMSHIGPLKWWAPEHRMVLFFDEARIEKTTRRLLKGGRFRITFDEAFDEVVRGCARPRPGRTPLTWITPRIQQLFQGAYEAGYAHSVEVWQGDELVGGIFGLAVGKVFFTESQFHTARDASKVAFAVLNRHLQAWGFALNDGKHVTPHLVASGFRPLARDEFTAAVVKYSGEPGRIGRWGAEPALLGSDWKPEAATGLKMIDVLPDEPACKWTADELLSERRSNTW
jgi:leucyl/phenylalanyl-tRNA---protein transferase